jgi:type I restriction enzyme M protein
VQNQPSLDITWVKDISLVDFDNLPYSDILATEILEILEACLESFRAIAGKLAAK